MIQMRTNNMAYLNEKKEKHTQATMQYAICICIYIIVSANRF